MAAAAAAAAAAVQARLAAEGKLQPTSAANGQAPLPPGGVPPPPPGIAPPAAEQATAEISVNDVSSAARMLLTRGPEQERLQVQLNVALTTRGRFYPPGQTPKNAHLNSAADQPLHIFIEAKDQATCDKAVEHLQQLIEEASAGGAAPHEAPSGRPRPSTFSSAPSYMQQRPVSHKVYLDMIDIPGFNLRGKVAGEGGQYLAHVSSETGCLAELRGRGSGFESSESMHIFLEHTDHAQLDAAKSLCKNLIDTVREEYNEFKKQRQEDMAKQAAAGPAPVPSPYNYAQPPYGYAQPPYGALPSYGSYQPAVAMPPYGWHGASMPMGAMAPHPGYPAAYAAGHGAPVQPQAVPHAASPYDAAPPVSSAPTPQADAPPTTAAPPPPAGPPTTSAGPTPPLPAGPPPSTNEIAAAPKRKFTEAVSSVPATTAPFAPHEQQYQAPETVKKARGDPLVEYK